MLVREHDLSLREIGGSGELFATFAHYRPNRRQRVHQHEFHQISFMLVGQMRETLAGRALDLDVSAMGFKPAGVDHADEIGPHGALVFAIRATSPDLGLAAGWSRLAATHELTELIARALRATDRTCLVETLWDLAAFEREPVARTMRVAPRWLEHVRQEICEAPASPRIDAVANRAGVHRVHLSRMFRRHYGIAPSEYRARARAARAVSQVVEQRCDLARIACESGYADHGHLAREIKRLTGLAPSAIRALLA